MEMKIFELQFTRQDECEWISGRTAIEALKTYLSNMGDDFSDLEDEDEITEVPKEKWSEMTVRNTNYDETDPNSHEKITFEEWMKQNSGSACIAGTISG